MQSEIENIKNEHNVTHPFSLEFYDNKIGDQTVQTITFRDKNSYELFVMYLNQTETINPNNRCSDLNTLYKAGRCKHNDQEKKVSLYFGHGNHIVIGKFLLQVGLDWPEYYKLDKKRGDKKYKPFLEDEAYGEEFSEFFVFRLCKAKLTEDIKRSMKKMKNANEIKQFVAHLLQDKSTTISPELLPLMADELINSALPFDTVTNIVNDILNPALAKEKANIISCQPNDITTSGANMSVSLNTSESFTGWFDNLPKQKSITLADNKKLFKSYNGSSNDILFFSSGPGTPGIIITKEGKSFSASNNVTADISFPGIEERKKHLITYIGELQKYIPVEEINTKDVKKTEPEIQTCAMQHITMRAKYDEYISRLKEFAIFIDPQKGHHIVDRVTKITNLLSSTGLHKATRIKLAGELLSIEINSDNLDKIFKVLKEIENAFPVLQNQEPVKPSVEGSSKKTTNNTNDNPDLEIKPKIDLSKDYVPSSEKLGYSFVCSDITLAKAEAYLQELRENKAKAGKYLSENLKAKNLSQLTLEEFIECLVQTKKDQIAAERTAFMAKTNWNEKELSILGDLSCVIPTKAYDDGTWTKPNVHVEPLDVTLIYVPGPLFAIPHPSLEALVEKPDLNEVCPDGQFNDEAYYNMIERRLLPGLLHVNAKAHSQNKELLITVPGIGCGYFAGPYSDVIHNKFQAALERLLEKHGHKLTQIKALWYDNYDKEPAKKIINTIDLLVRPLMKGGLPQLCAPQKYGKEYANCELVSFVAWDHVSKPGNDYWVGVRTTDDGVKAAATGTMPELTGIEGIYVTDKMVPKDNPKVTWSKRTKENTILKVAGNLHEYTVQAGVAPQVNTSNNTNEASSTNAAWVTPTVNTNESLFDIRYNLFNSFDGSSSGPSNDLDNPSSHNNKIT